jgi:hypothetical protein
VEGFAVGFAENGGGTDAKFAAGAQDADGDFTAIGNQDFFEHAVDMDWMRFREILACEAVG